MDSSNPFLSPFGAALEGAGQGYQQGRSLDIQRQQFMAQLQMRQQLAQLMMQGRTNVAGINAGARLGVAGGYDPATGQALTDANGNPIAGRNATYAQQAQDTSAYHAGVLGLKGQIAVGTGQINGPAPNSGPAPPPAMMLPPGAMPPAAPPSMTPGAAPMPPAGGLAPPMPVPAGSNPYSNPAPPADPLAGLGPKARADIQASMATADKPTMQFLSSIPGAMAAVGRLSPAAQGPAVKALNLEASRRGISPIMAEPGTQTGTKNVPTLGPLAPINGVPQFLPDKQVPIMAPYLTPSATDAAKIAQQGAQAKYLGVRTATGQALLPGAVGLQSAKTNFYNTNTAGAMLKNTQIVPDALARRALEGAQGAAATSNAGTNAQNAGTNAGKLPIMQQNANTGAYRALHPAAGAAMLPNGLTPQMDAKLAQEYTGIPGKIAHYTAMLGTSGPSNGPVTDANIRAQGNRAIQALQARQKEISAQRNPPVLHFQGHQLTPAQARAEYVKRHGKFVPLGQ